MSNTESPAEPHATPEEAMPASGTAFMTGISAERGNEVSEFPVLSSTFPSLVRTYQSLMTTLENLPGSVESLVSSHSDSCYLAYKTHMYGVQTEYASLLSLAQAQETRTKQDDTIQSLEAELEWFMAEALRLDLLLTQSLVKDEAKLKSEISITTDDVKFLERQVRRKPQLGLPQTISDVPLQTAMAIVTTLQPPVLQTAPTPTESPQVREKRRELERLKRELLALQSAQAKRTRKLNELEKLFLASVEETRKHIAHCRHLNKVSDIGNSATEKLIGNPQVLALLYERIFPWKDSHKHD